MVTDKRPEVELFVSGDDGQPTREYVAIAFPTGPSSSPMTTSGSAAAQGCSDSTSASPLRRMIRPVSFFLTVGFFFAIRSRHSSGNSDAAADPMLDMFDFGNPSLLHPTLPDAPIDPAGVAACDALHPPTMAVGLAR